MRHVWPRLVRPNSMDGRAEHSLLQRLPIGKRRSHRRAGLRDVIPLSCYWLGYDTTVVLMAPYNEVDAIVEHAFRN